MRTHMKRTSPEVALTRILDAVAQELVSVSDEEVLEAAKQLGMDLSMKESAAFAGLTYPAKPQLCDFFDLEVCKSLHAPVKRIGAGKKAPKRK